MQALFERFENSTARSGDLQRDLVVCSSAPLVDYGDGFAGISSLARRHAEPRVVEIAWLEAGSW